ncbi:hypothetical protein AXG93_2841s1020 [Marchantia polymorpha subsp. ruderalis]|uniref:Poly A polymerase head domain-containing protein n=1 Tax=Marchantia polymorpha subsp. ruderalis TaxID=1480154 RepID=A0A176WR31_MARPO|nr:hypothetical protein AXG93_2841s1020 [Marchantia polymorpha subsp. ruderalis]
MTTSVALHRAFYTGWRHSTVASICSIAAQFKALPLLDSESTFGEFEGPVAAVALREAVEDTDVARTPSSTSGDSWQLTFFVYAAFLEIGKQPMQVQLKVLRGKQHGLHDSLIPRSTWRVLDNLHDAGYETYLVGGSVRDLLLEQVPKDFDVLSTAEPNQVSSFSTQLRNKKKEVIAKPKKVSSNDTVVRGTEGWDERDFARWENSMKRDFTINGLMYDPFKHLLYDYVGGLRDLKKFKVRTVIPADESFAEDTARILRAIRIAARLGFTFTRSTARAIKDQRFSLLKLNKGRLMLEANMFFAYGAAEPSLRLLWRYGVLELILPLQAAHFVETNFRRREEGSNFLLDLFRNLDKVVAPDRPCHGSLWVALLAFHLATTEGKCSPVVIGAAALTMYHTTNRQKAAEKAIRIHAKLHKQVVSPGGEAESIDSAPVSNETVLEEATVLVENAKACLNRMMDAAVTTQVMQELTGAEPEDSIALAQAFSQKALGLFRGAVRDELGDFNSKHRQEALKRESGKRSPPDAEAITRGDVEAISYLFSRIVLNTLYPREVKT